MHTEEQSHNEQDLIAKNADFIADLKGLDSYLKEHNKHDRAVMLIKHCISSEFRVPRDIVALMVEAGYNEQHIWIRLKEDQSHEWVMCPDGTLQAL